MDSAHPFYRIAVNAGVIQVFGARNLRMAQDFANIVGGISAEQIMKMEPDEQLLLIEERMSLVNKPVTITMSCFRRIGQSD